MVPVLAVQALLLALSSGCGGSSGSGGGSSTPASIPSAAGANGAILGNVSELIDDTPLAQVQVRLLADGSDTPAASTFSDIGGDFGFENVPRGPVYRLEFDVDGFRNERYEAIDLEREPTLQLEPVSLVSDDNAGLGGLAGTITNAVDGLPVVGAALQFRPGINVRDGVIAARATTDANGDYLVEGVSYGNVTVEVAGQGLQTAFSTSQVLGDIIRDDQNVAISPFVPAGETRIVLTWDERPRDLDAHLTGPGTAGSAPFHVFFSQPDVSGATLDIDDTTSFGPETITFDASRPGVYRYTVNAFSQATPDELSDSGARVQVLRAEGVIAEFFVPSGEGNLWTVFDLIDGQFRRVDTIGTQASDDDWFAPETRASR